MEVEIMQRAEWYATGDKKIIRRAGMFKIAGLTFITADPRDATERDIINSNMDRLKEISEE